MRFSIDFTNKLMDYIFRGQSLSLGNYFYVGLFTEAPTTSKSGKEVVGTEYKRMPIERSLFGFCGTQGNESTDISTGVSGTISNNEVIEWAAPVEEDWGTVVGCGLFLEETGTEPYIFYSDLTSPVSVTKEGPSISFPVASFSIQLETRS